MMYVFFGFEFVFFFFRQTENTVSSEIGVTKSEF